MADVIGIAPGDPVMRFVPLWGNWVPDAVLGEGSFGRVYRVHRADAPQYVSAVKHIRIPKTEAERAEAAQLGMDEASMAGYFDGMASRILKEIDLMYALRGEAHIVAYEDHQIFRTPQPFVVDIFIRMELLIPLSDYVRGNPVSADEVRRIGIEICSALEACEAYHVIHRDIKEANVLLNSRGVFKLGDFGIARELAGASTGMSMKGTPAYIAPEVYNGRHYDATVDMYSLGILMYKLLNNGRFPFLPSAPLPVSVDDHENAFNMRMRGAVPYPPANGDGALKAAVMKAISFDFRERFASATQMRQALMGRDAPYAASVQQVAPVVGGAYPPSPAPARPIAAIPTAAPQTVPATAPVRPRKKPSPLAIIGIVLFAVMAISAIGLLVESETLRAQLRANSLSAVNSPAYTDGGGSSAPVERTMPQTSAVKTPAPSATPVELTPAVFADPQFEALIRQLLNRPHGDILRGELTEIECLSILADRCFYEYYDYFALGSGRDLSDGSYEYYGTKYPRGTLSDISDLRYFPNLKELNISCTEITDISVLYQLPQIETLRLTSNIYLSDISPIASLEYLKGDLQLFRNNISDLAPLSGLKNLTKLTLSSNNISDLTPLAGLTGLTRLNLYKNRIADISPLSGMVLMEDLRLNANQVSDLTPLAGMAKLKELRLNINNIVDIWPLRTLAALETLYIQDNSINSIYVLRELPNLKYVNVKNNPIFDYSPLMGIPDAEY